jgi:hypothetical protein
MAQAHQLPSGSFSLDSLRYTWEVRHFAGATSPYVDARGISVGVTLDGVTRKELIIDFPFKDYGFAKPRSMGVFEERIKKCARLALAKGWDPESKGKPFRADAEWLEDKTAG